MNSSQSAAWHRSLAGKTVGKYKLIKFVGSGKIGHVYSGQHQEIPTCVRAIKLVFDKLKPGWEVELQKVSQLSLVDGVVHYHESGETKLSDGATTHLCEYSVWDYIAPGENLRDYLDRIGRVQVSFLVAVVERILHVLHACKEYGVARHGDLHSGNILIGDRSPANLDTASLQPREPIYVSDFGYGATGATTPPKDDYEGLTYVINDIVKRVGYSTATTSTDRQMLSAIQAELGKLLQEPNPSLRRSPFELLQLLLGIKKSAQADDSLDTRRDIYKGQTEPAPAEASSVGQFQVSEMIGDRWEWWQHLFVPTVPARSKLLALSTFRPSSRGRAVVAKRCSSNVSANAWSWSVAP